MKFIKVAESTELGPGEKRKISWEDHQILLTNVGNSYYAIDNKCPHMGGSLSEGTLDGTQITCPRHGSVFDVTTGKVVQSGKLLFIKVHVHDLHSYPVKIEGTDILIGIE